MDTEAMATTVRADPNLTESVDGTPPPRRISWLAVCGLGLAIVLMAGVVAGFVVRVPYTTIAPGEALSLRSRVTIKGAESFSDPTGDIRLLFVREAGHVNVWQYVRARLDSDIDVVKDGAANPGKLTSRQLTDQGLQQMADAKNDATVVALRAAGREVGIAPGLTVSDLSTDLPAIKVLYWGDVIRKVDGKKVVKPSDLTAAIAQDRVGGQVTLDITRDGAAKTVRVPITTSEGRKIIGVVVSPRFTFPVNVSVDTTGIGGPSAGLAMTLAILDKITPGNLTGGKNIAVTGTIDAVGDVGEIGGIDQKAVAARAAGVSLFIVPACSPNDPPPYLAACKADLVSASKRAGSGIKVVPVSTFAQALNALRDAGGAPVKATGPTTSTTTTA